MKQFIIDFYIKPFREDFLMAVVGVLLWITTIALMFGSVYGILYLIDYSCRPVNEGYGIVVKKEFKPEHTQTIMVYNAATKTSIPQIVYYSDEWIIFIEVNGLLGSKSMCQEDYNNLHLHQRVNLKYSYGRIWKTLYIKKIFIY